MSAFFKTELTKILLTASNSYSATTIESAKRFEADCKGAADSEMDIDFQERGRGYYAHLHQLTALEETDLNACSSYRQQLLQEIEDSEGCGEVTAQMLTVKAQLQ